MGVEIEYKFLVDLDEWDRVKHDKQYKLTRWKRCDKLTQYYIADSPKCVTRVRINYTTLESILCIKNEKLFNRLEFEYEIPLKDAKEMIELSPYFPVDKVRHVWYINNKKWEVDEYLGDNKGLVTAEIEVESEDEKVIVPEWVGKDVTEIPEYANYCLAKKPFNQW